MSGFVKLSEVNPDKITEIASRENIRMWIPYLVEHSSEITNWDKAFYESKLTILPPGLNMCNAESINDFCYHCYEMVAFLYMNLSNVKTADRAFAQCSKLKYVNMTQCHGWSSIYTDRSLTMDLSSIESMNEMFQYCREIESLSLSLNKEKPIWLSKMKGAFDYMYSLKNLDFCGTKIYVNVGQSYTFLGKDPHSGSPNKFAMEATGVVNFLNALDNPNNYSCTINLPSSVLEKLSDEQKAIATGKNLVLKGV